MGKKKCKKEIDYTDLTASDIKDMIVRDSSDLKYERVNITIPSSVKQKIDTYFSDEPRSNLITRLLLNELEKKEREVFLKTEAKKAPKDVEVIILSNDQDMLQLTEITNVKVLRPASGPFVKEKIYDIKEVISKFGFEPLKIIDYKALRGDPSDNIPGVKGIGEKTAKDLLAQFNSLEDIYKNIEKIDKERTKKLLAESAEESVLSKELATIDTNIPIQFDLNAYIVHDYDIKKVEEVFAKYEFSSLLKKLKSLKVKEENKKAQEELAGMTSMF